MLYDFFAILSNLNIITSLELMINPPSFFIFAKVSLIASGAIPREQSPKRLVLNPSSKASSAVKPVKFNK